MEGRRRGSGVVVHLGKGKGVSGGRRFSVAVEQRETMLEDKRSKVYVPFERRGGGEGEKSLGLGRGREPAAGTRSSKLMRGIQ